MLWGLLLILGCGQPWLHPAELDHSNGPFEQPTNKCPGQPTTNSEALHMLKATLSIVVGS